MQIDLSRRLYFQRVSSYNSYAKLRIYTLIYLLIKFIVKVKNKNQESIIIKRQTGARKIWFVFIFAARAIKIYFYVYVYPIKILLANLFYFILLFFMAFERKRQSLLTKLGLNSKHNTNAIKYISGQFGFQNIKTIKTPLRVGELWTFAKKQISKLKNFSPNNWTTFTEFKSKHQH